MYCVEMNNNTTPYTPPTVTPMVDVQPQNVMRAGSQAAHNAMMDRTATRAQLNAAKRSWTRPRVEQSQKPPKLKRPTKVRKTKPPQPPFAQPPGQAAAPVTLSAVTALLLEEDK